MIIADFPNPGNQLGGQSDVTCEIVAGKRRRTFTAREN